MALEWLQIERGAGNRKEKRVRSVAFLESSDSPGGAWPSLTPSAPTLCLARIPEFSGVSFWRLQRDPKPGNGTVVRKVQRDFWSAGRRRF